MKLSFLYQFEARWLCVIIYVDRILSICESVRRYNVKIKCRSEFNMWYVYPKKFIALSHKFQLFKITEFSNNIISRDLIELLHIDSN